MKSQSHTSVLGVCTKEGKKGRLRATRGDTVGLPASQAGSQMPPENAKLQLLLRSLPSDKTHQNKTTETPKGEKSASNC